MDIIGEKIDLLAKELQAEINFAEISSLLVEIGWIRVVRERPMTAVESKDIDKWVKNHCKDEVRVRGLVWLFKDERDAIWFKLTWL